MIEYVDTREVETEARKLWPGAELCLEPITNQEMRVITLQTMLTTKLTDWHFLDAKSVKIPKAVADRIIRDHKEMWAAYDPLVLEIHQQLKGLLELATVADCSPLEISYRLRPILAQLEKVILAGPQKERLKG